MKIRHSSISPSFMHALARPAPPTAMSFPGCSLSLATSSLLPSPLITVPAEKPASIENYERVVGLLYLFIGLFIFIRRWNAPRAIHFYVFCLVSFVLFSFH